MFVFKIKKTHEVKKHSVATNEASDGACPPLIATTSGRLALLATHRVLSLLGSLGWAGVAQGPTRSAGMGLHRYNFRAMSSPGRCSCGLAGNEG